MARLVDDLLAFSRANHPPTARPGDPAGHRRAPPPTMTQAPARAVDWRIAAGVGGGGRSATRAWC